MKWAINTMLNIGFFAISIIVALLLFNAFMTISVAQANHMFDSITGAASANGMNIDVAPSDNGFVIGTRDGSMTLTQDGIEIPEFSGF